MDAPLSHPARRDRPTDRTHCGLHTLSVVASGRRIGVAGRAVLIAAKARRQWVNDSGFETPVLRQNSIHMRFQQLRLSFSQPKISRSKFDSSIEGSLITAS